jgi:hypothetical protein
MVFHGTFSPARARGWLLGLAVTHLTKCSALETLCKLVAKVFSHPPRQNRSSITPAETHMFLSTSL